MRHAAWIASALIALGVLGGCKGSHNQNSAQVRMLNAVVDAEVWIDGNGELLEKRTQLNEVTGGRRFTVRFRRLDKNKPVELRAHLARGKETFSETWSYIIPQDS